METCTHTHTHGWRPLLIRSIVCPAAVTWLCYAVTCHAMPVERTNEHLSCLLTGLASSIALLINSVHHSRDSETHIRSLTIRS
ncbi:hypothetical protein DER46DRAFT_153152 [Fusarium sp. MPI-SDFR-AT-0072]|nr:hypothetical protein DER46DRAFT_153152 [Fusarium sp. MPI-SDFR-AT-0072]